MVREMAARIVNACEFKAHCPKLMDESGEGEGAWPITSDRKILGRPSALKRIDAQQ